MHSNEHRRRFNTSQAAAYLDDSNGDLSPRSLERWRWAGGGLVYVRLGKRVFYEKADLDAWLASKRRLSTTVPATVPAAA
jgi:hypothetical protein